MSLLELVFGVELILTGDPIPAEKAYELGLVNRLVQPGEELETAWPTGPCCSCQGGCLQQYTSGICA